MKKLIFVLIIAISSMTLLSACGGGHSAYRCPAYGKIIVPQVDKPS